MKFLRRSSPLKLMNTSYVHRDLDFGKDDEEDANSIEVDEVNCEKREATVIQNTER